MLLFLPLELLKQRPYDVTITYLGISNIVEDLEIPIEENNASIGYNELPKIKGYPTLIYQLFYNLINNSLKFRRKDVSPKIYTSFIEVHKADRSEAGNDYFKIDLKDNGVGFDSTYSEKIFESFTRLHPKDKFEGTGLGLALCRKIVLRHHGSIEATGEINNGATFNVYLPTAILVKAASRDSVPGGRMMDYLAQPYS